MDKRVVFIGVFVASLSFANAGMAQDDSEKCIGPMCLFTPVYRLGRNIMPGEPERPTAPANVPEHADSTADAPKPPTAPVGNDHFKTPDQGPAAAAKDDADTVARDEPPPEKSGGKAHPRSKPLAKRYSAPAVRRPRHFASRGSYSSDTVAPVIVSAGEPEMSRLMTLASMVKTPPITVVRDNGFGPGCSADYVVDTLSNPDRQGPAIPLFSENLIIVARKNVANLRALRGRHVSFGPSGGSSERVAQRLFKSLDVPVHELPLDVDNALDGLALGDLDAVALLVPRGYDRLSKHDPQLHLLGLDPSMIAPEGLRISRIDPASYLGGTWSERSLSVIAVDAVLSPNREATRRSSAMSLYAAIDRGASQLAQNGFDLIGEDSRVVTMRSVAEGDPPVVRRHGGFAGTGCDR